MIAKAILVALVAATAIPMTASAETYGCINQSTLVMSVCMSAGGWSWGNGTCASTPDNYNQGNGAGVSVGTATSSYGAGAYAHCSQWNMAPYSGSSSGMFAYVHTWDGTSGTYDSVGWFSGTWSDGTNSYSYCDTVVDVADQPQWLGCPAGGPPADQMPLLP